MHRKQRKSKGKEAYLADRIKQSLDGLSKKYNLKVDKTKVLCDLTCVREKYKGEEKFQLILGYAEVDIAIFIRIPINKDKIKATDLIKLYQDKRNKQNKQAKENNQDYLNIPFVILELKSGKLQSDSIRARNVVAKKIRDVFPFCAYFFIAENTDKKDITLFRQGKDFTNFYTSRNKLNDLDMKKIREMFIEPHLENLKAHFGKKILDKEPA
jgi:hypothetical protein